MPSSFSSRSRSTSTSSPMSTLSRSSNSESETTPFRLVANINENLARPHLEDVAFDDGSFPEVAHRLRNQFLHSSHNVGLRISGRSAANGLDLRAGGLRVVILKNCGESPSETPGRRKHGEDQHCLVNTFWQDNRPMNFRLIAGVHQLRPTQRRMNDPEKTISCHKRPRKSILRGSTVALPIKPR